MNYIYDVLVNFQNEVKEFYEWDKTDYILHLRKTPILKVKTSFLKHLFYNEIKVEKKLLEVIQNKTEFFNHKKNNYKFISVFTDSLTSIVVQFDEQGKILGRSLLQMEEDMEVLDISEHLKIQEFSYSILTERSYNPFFTQNELKKQEFIHDMFNTLEKDKNIEKLKYIYYDCFTEICENKEEIVKRFHKELQEKNIKVEEKLYSFFNLFSSSIVK